MCGEASGDAAAHSYDADNACVCGHKLVEVVTQSTATLKAMLQLDFLINYKLLSGTDNYAIITRTYADGDNKNAVDQIRINQIDWVKYDNNLKMASYTKIAAKEMGDQITIVIYNAQGQQLSIPKTDCIKAYAYRGLDSLKNTTDSKYKTLRTMLVDMLNYGAAAQVQFNYDTENLVNADLTEAQKAWETKTDVEVENKQDNGIGGWGRTLTLKSAIQMDFLFKTNVVGGASTWKNLYAIATYVDHYGNTKTVRVEGKDFVKYNSSVVQVSVVGMAVADYQSLVTCVVYNSNNEVVGTSTDSMEGYAKRAIDSEAASAELKTLLKCLMKFSAGADKYFNK